MTAPAVGPLHAPRVLQAGENRLARLPGVARRRPRAWHGTGSCSAPPSANSTVLGFPAPGHPYWNEETLDGVAARYPYARHDTVAGGQAGERRRRGMTLPEPTSWWKAGVLYQIYPRSFADSDGDGIGDLRGILDHLDHLEWLGVDGIWLSPITVSPNADWGYDVADFCAVAARPGDHGRRRPPGRRGRPARHPGPDGPGPEPHQRPAPLVRRLPLVADGPPAATGTCGPTPSRTARRPTTGSAASAGRPGRWTRRPGSTTCTTTCPSSPTSTGGTRRSARPSTTSCASGSTGAWPASASTCATSSSRTPSCATTRRPPRTTTSRPSSSASARSTTPTGPRSTRSSGAGGASPTPYDPPRVLIGETPVPVDAAGRLLRQRARRAAPGLQLPVHQRPARGRGHARRRRGDRGAACPPGAWPAWTGSNHDMSRFATRWAKDDPRRTRVALLMLLGLRGTPVLYQGDEIGLGDRAGRPRSSCGTPWACATGPHYAGARRHAHPDAVAERARRWLHRPRRHAVAAAGGRRCRQRGGPADRSGVHAHAGPRSASPCAGAPPTCTPVPTFPSRHRRASGPGAGVIATWWRST